jgi:hypothetical protein
VGFFWISLLFQESRVILIGIPGECWPEKPYDFEFHYHMLLWKNSSRSWRISFLVCGLDASEILQHFNRNFRSKKHPALPNINNNFLFECQKKNLNFYKNHEMSYVLKSKCVFSPKFYKSPVVKETCLKITSLAHLILFTPVYFNFFKTGMTCRVVFKSPAAAAAG